MNQKEKDHSHGKIRIGIVGPCGSGKTTLIKQLQKRRDDLDLFHIAQEHSYVADMWKRLVDPDLLIYLDASYPTATKRRNLNWSKEDYSEQLHRLRNAHELADLIIPTDGLTPDQIADQVNDFIRHTTEPYLN